MFISAPCWQYPFPRSSSFISFFSKINRLHISNFREVFRLTENWPKSTESSTQLLLSPPNPPTASPINSIPHQCGTFVTTNEPTSVPCYQAKSIVYLALKCCNAFVGLTNGTMTCIHHYCVIQSSFSVLKVLCALLSFHPPPHQRLKNPNPPFSLGTLFTSDIPNSSCCWQQPWLKQRGQQMYFPSPN